MDTKEKKRPTKERLIELFHYDAETGIFIRKSPSKRGPKERKYGAIGAGRISELGYVMIMADGINYIAGQLAWRYQTGEWPRRIHYLNGNKVDNRFANIGVYSRSAEEIKSEKLTLGRLKELVHYEPSTGWFTWRVSSPAGKPGDRLGSVHGLGYRQIGLDYKKYLEHTLAWFYMTGEWPTNEIDHINGDKSDNIWVNLRHVSRSVNSHNKPMNRRNSVGFPGVNKHGTKYRSRVLANSKIVDRGVFHTVAEARIARLLAEKEFFGEFTSWSEGRDGILPLGDKFINIFVRENRLYVQADDGSQHEVTDVKQIETIPITDEGSVIH